MSLVRGLPFSQVQSASEKGSIFFGLASFEAKVADATSPAALCPVGAVAAAVAGAAEVDGAAGVVVVALALVAVFELVAAGDASFALEFFSASSSSSMRFRMASSSFTISADI